MKKPCHATKTKKPAAAPKAKSAIGKGKTITPLNKVCEIKGKNPSPSTVVASGTSIYKYPKVVQWLKKAKPKGTRPRASKEPTKYHGGKIDFDRMRKSVRCYRRDGDRLSQLFPAGDWSKKEARKETWNLACAVIETDPRPAA